VLSVGERLAELELTAEEDAADAADAGPGIMVAAFDVSACDAKVEAVFGLEAMLEGPIACDAEFTAFGFEVMLLEPDAGVAAEFGLEAMLERPITCDAEFATFGLEAMLEGPAAMLTAPVACDARAEPEFVPEAMLEGPVACDTGTEAAFEPEAMLDGPEFPVRAANVEAGLTIEGMLAGPVACEAGVTAEFGPEPVLDGPELGAGAEVDLGAEELIIGVQSAEGGSEYAPV
jgi:hypothetical protein